MTHLALFNGIGGFQLAASWMGWENVAHVEIDEWCNKVITKNFPKSICHTDIKQFDGTQYRVWFIGRLSNTGCIGFKSNKKLQEGQQYREGRKAFNFIDSLYRISRTEYRRCESTFSGGINGISDELDELKAIGNAIVPQVAYQIFKAINETSL